MPAQQDSQELQLRQQRALHVYQEMLTAVSPEESISWRPESMNWWAHRWTEVDLSGSFIFLSLMAKAHWSLGSTTLWEMAWL